VLTIEGKAGRLCDRVPRRDFLRVGGLSAAGLSLPGLWQARRSHATETRTIDSPTFGKAKHCILLFMWGGPPHQDTFDPKPEASAETRGEFTSIPTNAPGVSIIDHLPLLAQQADKYHIVRTVHHTNGDHIAVSHDALTGNVYHKANPVITAARNDHPHYGAVLSHLKPRNNNLPAYVQLPCLLQSNSGKVIPGQHGGFLGQKYDPFMVRAVPNIESVQDPEFKKFTPSEINLPHDVTIGRLSRRRGLLETVDNGFGRLERTAETRGFDGLYEQAFSFLAAADVRKAFDLSAVETARRDRYGRHTFGQGTLLARQLVHAGVPLVTVYWPNGPRRTDIGWDNHVNNFRNLKNWQLPPVDRAFSALLEDLAETGKLDETLVVWMGEFGRSPSIDERGGRQHWPFCYSAVLAGAGIRGGEVYGESDEIAAYPQDLPVPLVDLGATIYHYLGIDVNTHLTDAFTGQPHPVCRGSVVKGLI